MTGRLSSASNDPRQEIQDAEFEEVRDYPEPKQWAPSTSGSASAGFTGYIFDLVMRRPILKWWMWITFIAGSAYILLILQRAFEVFAWVAVGVAIWPYPILNDNIGGGIFWSAIIASILCWKWRGQVKREKASERQSIADRSGHRGNV